MKIYPSLISGNLLHIQQMLTELDGVCDGYHIDVMDDHFVPNLTWGPAFVNAIRGGTTFPLDVHLMVDNPEEWVERLSLQQGDYFVFHYEACQNVEGLLSQVKAKGWKAGVALSPKTPVDAIENFLSAVDHVLIMSVEPGFSGQAFLPEVVEKVSQLLVLREEKGLSFTIGIDGGIGLENIKMVVDAGVDIVGAASAIFSQPDAKLAIEALRKAARE